MAELRDAVFYRYSPELMSEDVLRKLFVGRGKLLESLFEELKSAAEKKTPRFYLIVGPRGIGKSHFLVLLYYEIKNKLGSLLIPIKLAEEEYSVFRASDLLLRILEEQSVETSDIVALGTEDEVLHAALEKLIRLSEEDGRTYLIFIENLHELFRQFDTAELQKLRSIFQRYDIFSVVASSPMIFPGISEHDEPFYGFFRTQHLREFSRDEITTLILKIAEVEDNRKFIEEFKQYEERIHGMMHLTGGSPRLVILFYEMIVRGELKDTEKAFFKIIDEHTPYYQEVFQLLTGQRRRLFDILIAAGAPATPKQIAERSRISNSTVVSQLRRLEKDGYVISRREGRHTYYEVRERLFRLWREMRQPFGRKRVSILLEFLQLWYTPKEREGIFKTKFDLLESGERAALRDLCYYAEIQPPEYRAEALLRLTPKLMEFGESAEAEHAIRELKGIAVQSGDGGLEGKTWWYEAKLRLSEGKYDDALEAFDKVLEINPKNEDALSWKGLALFSFDRYEDSLDAFDKALEINPKKEIALLYKGIALLKLKRYAEALDASKNTMDAATSESSKIHATLISIEAHISLDKRSDAVPEIEKIKDKISEQEPHLIKDFAEVCLNLALGELKIENRGNATRLMKMAYDAGTNLKDDRTNELTMTFIKDAVKSGDISVTKAAVDEVIKLYGDLYRKLLKPVIEAIGIVETGDTKRYYSLQVEEREMAADIVRTITGSDELCPL
jgi:tetratricopeptide (TPR) repeat protein